MASAYSTPTPSNETELRPLWNRAFRFDWRLGLVLVLLVCIPRFALVLRANLMANYGLIGLVMVISAVIPFLFLTRYGRKRIGITRPTNYRWLGYSFLLGVLVSAILFIIGYGLYEDTFSNWYVYIGKSYSIPDGVGGQDKLIYFSLFALTGMTFSPIGEELFFRGIVHASFANSVGERQASLIDSLSFALTHLAHFGLVYVADAWQFLPLPAALWVLGMFVTSLVFFRCKQRTGSIRRSDCQPRWFQPGYDLFHFLPFIKNGGNCISYHPGSKNMINHVLTIFFNYQYTIYKAAIIPRITNAPTLKAGLVLNKPGESSIEFG